MKCLMNIKHAVAFAKIFATQSARNSEELVAFFGQFRSILDQEKLATPLRSANLSVGRAGKSKTASPMQFVCGVKRALKSALALVKLEKTTTRILVTIANDRLPPPATNMSVHDYLACYLERLPFQDTSAENPNPIDKSSRIIIIAMDSNNSLWQQQYISRPDECIVLSQGAAVISTLLKPTTVIAMFCEGIKAACMSQFWSLSRQAKTLVAACIAYNSILKIINPTSIILTTANSRSDESLRFCALLQAKMLTEYAHGVWTPELVWLQEQVIRITQQTFLRVPCLPFLNSLSPQISSGAEANRVREAQSATNLTFSSHKIRLIQTKDDPVSFARNRAVVDAAQSGRLIIAIIGGNDRSETIDKSDAFRLEINVMEELLKQGERQGSRPFLLYCSHPARKHIITDFINQYALVRPNFREVLVCTSLISALLVADFSFSCYSSAIFESQHMNVKTIVFTNALRSIYEESIISHLEQDCISLSVDSYGHSLSKLQYAVIPRSSQALLSVAWKRLAIAGIVKIASGASGSEA